MVASCETWTKRYEDLRRDWFEQQIGWGQALFIQQGLIAWMKAWPRESPPSPVSTPVHECEPFEVSGQLRRELTSELVNLICHHHQEAFV